LTDERALRTAEAARASGGAYALLTSAAAVVYAAGLAAPADVALLPFAGGPPTAVVAADGTVGLVVPDILAAEPVRADVVRSYDAFAPCRPDVPLPEAYARALAALLAELGCGGVAAVEPTSLPASAAALAGDGRVDLEPALADARARKTADELAQLRRCAALTDVAQGAALAAVRPGASELDVFAAIAAAIDAAAGEHVHLAADLLSGPERTAEVMGGPTARVLEAGDPVICDVVPRLGGYFGDSCNTLAAGGELAPGVRPLYRAAAEALAVAAGVLRPAISAGALDAAVRGAIAAHGLDDPIHVGHGIGTASSEHPRIVPGADAVLAPEMVLMLEPGAYAAGVGGVRLEWMFRVTETGNEVLSGFAHVLAG
jgi:Xaa-Pro aminopeptidase